jgi:ABC-type transporter Mla subunit MlaD
VTEENTQDTSSQFTHNQSGNPLDQLLQLLTLVDPIELAGKAVDTTRRTTETLMSVLENFASTIDNLNRTTTRVNALLDDIEEPLKRVMPQLGNAMNAMATMGEAATQLAELSKRLGPLTTLAENAGGLFGFRPSKPTSGSGATSSSPQTES